jgi:hypothetical protein
MIDAAVSANSLDTKRARLQQETLKRISTTSTWW